MQSVRGIIWYPIAFFGIILCIGAPFTSKILRLLTLGEWGASKPIETTLEECYAWARRKHLVLAGLIYCLLLTAFPISSTALVLYEICLLVIGRSKLKATAGADFQGDQWGFGQIIAVFLWIPLCFKIIYFVMFVA